MLLIAALAANTASSQPAEYLALITDVEGEVVVAKASDRGEVDAVWGTQLSEGDRVRTLEGSQASILFSNNNLLTLGPNSSMTISAAPAAAEAKPVKKVDAPLFADVSDLMLRRGSDGDLAALGGLRSGGPEEAVKLQSPRNTLIKTTRPVFVWEAGPSFERFEVSLFDSDGLVWSRAVEENRLAYPEDAPPLAPDIPYYWRVEAEEMLESVTSPPASFRVLSEEAQREVAAREAEIRQTFSEDPDGSNHHFVVGAYYAKEGLLEDAIGSFQQIAERHPEAALPHEILGRLYRDVGQKDAAIDALQRAIALRQRQ